MNNLMAFYLTGGKLRIGKKEMTFELLRRDSALRPVLGHGAGELRSILPGSANPAEGEDYVILDFSLTAERRLEDDPTGMLNELKRRCGASVGGKLYYKGIYTGVLVCYWVADLDTEDICLRSYDGSGDK